MKSETFDYKGIPIRFQVDNDLWVNLDDLKMIESTNESIKYWMMDDFYFLTNTIKHNYPEIVCFGTSSRYSFVDGDGLWMLDTLALQAASEGDPELGMWLYARFKELILDEIHKAASHLTILDRAT